MTRAVVAATAGSAIVLPGGAGPWRCRQLLLSSNGRELTASFERPGTTDWVEVVVFAPDDGRPALRRMEHCGVAYRGALRERTPELRAETAALVLAIGESVDQRLAARPGASLAEALGRDAEPARLIFGRDALLGLLAPDLRLGAEFTQGYRFTDAYPSSHLQQADSQELALILDFRHDAGERRVLFEVRRRRDDRPVFASTRNFAISRLSFGREAPEGADELAALLAFVLTLKDHDELSVEFPDLLSDLAQALPAASEPSPDVAGVLNLAIDTGCGQACSFCSVQELSPPVAGDQRLHARLRADLESNRRRGVRRVRINGYDPLTYPRILEILEYARELGYERAELFSPCTRLADREFCAAVVERLPGDRTLYVPVYAASAEAHDRVVGRQGAFALVERALANLRALTAPGDVELIGVATRDGLADLAAAAAWARTLGVAFSAHMPYPSSQASTDRFFASVPRQTDVASVMAASLEGGVALPVHGIAPCVVFRSMRARGIHPERWLDSRSSSRPLPGTEYRSREFLHRAVEAEHGAFRAGSVACPHAAECALAPACPREHLSGYLTAHGASEFAAVSVEELVAAARD
ncbi:MAG TPA: radical SAM protein [Polyangiaceae bacterium]